MKKIVLIIIVLVLIVCLYFVQNGTFLNYENCYSIVNKEGKSVPAKIYSRTVNSRINGKEESVYEIIVFFDKNQYNPILFIPKYKMVGVLEGGRAGFIFFGEKVFQKSDKSNRFTTLTNSLVFGDGPPITNITFKDNEIVFNSFDELKRYGEILILKY
ncbi:hypothetical protein LXM63_12025 [Chryseobacterium gleum]|uniref:hypothetical protein n=1 Tax=Chryseobacterium gleum TaxID=250 RepID=UPI001E50D8E0|nr:hypothetical protein [Chryseobacterium gleum]MCE4065825.1 hypothetical protein [Chryseobacterium gleum]